jgi:xanthine dehydrogenase/oxidase
MGLQWSDNAYKHTNYDCKTSITKSATAGNTACRAPGVIQSVPVHELVLELAAESTGLTPEAVREANFYKAGDETPYGYAVGTANFNWTVPALWEKAKSQWQIAVRRADTAAFNKANAWRKRGLSFLPIKYGMLGSAGGNYQIASSVRIMGGDGTVHVVHGGCEIGQGIHTKVAQAVAYALGCPISAVEVGTTSSIQTPNSTSTGGSGTSESSVRSVLAACDKLSTTLKPFRSAGEPWSQAVEKAARAGAELNASGWANVSTPETFAYATYGDGRGCHPSRRPAHGPRHTSQPRGRPRSGGRGVCDGDGSLPD